MIKPDAVAAGNAGNILQHFEDSGLSIVACRRLRLSRSQAEAFYAVHKARPFFGELVDFNQRRWYPELQPSSRLIGGTPVMIPTDSAVPGAKGIAATVSATNYVHWRVDYETGDQADLDEADVRRGFWHHRSVLLPLRFKSFRCSLG